jgi:two-component system, cell cycle sensor histidine kinase and response regulator CckA
MLTNLLDDERVGAVVLNVRDVTERRELEEQLRESQKMEAVGLLAGGIAHDFNNLLTAITGYTALLIDEVPDDAPMRSDLDQIQVAANRAAALVEQLLQFSRRQPTNPVLLDVNEVIASLGSFFRRVIGEHIQLETVLATDTGLIRADRSQMEQVVMNFVVNARDAMPGGGTLTIESAAVRLDAAEAERLGLRPGRHLRLDVTDTGSGMEDAVAARVFEPFYTTKGVGEGTGLGLSTVYGIVNQAHGHVSVTSRLGAGTTFTVHLPVAEGTDEPPAILLAAGHETTRVAVRGMLEHNGFRVVEAADGDAALAAAAIPQALDLLLVDVALADQPGPEIADALLAHRPDLRVLYLSGPVDPQQLISSIRSSLDGRTRR